MADDRFYAWVRVGDGDPEPAVIAGKRGARKATTLGCPDPFMIDEPGCPCRLVYDRNGEGWFGDYTAEMEPPEDELSEAEAKQYVKEWRAYSRAQKHSYAGFGQKDTAP